MCMKATCAECKKTTWWGCGQHIPSVMDEVPPADRCHCEPQVEVNGTKYPPKAAQKD